MSSLESKLDNILDRLSAEQLKFALKCAAKENRKVIVRALWRAAAEAERAAAEADLARRIVYIDGLGLDADDRVVLSAFEHGDIEDLYLLENHKNREMKSWIWMVLFKNREAAIRAVRQPPKTIGGQLVSCRLACDPPSNAAAAAAAAAAVPSNGQQP